MSGYILNAGVSGRRLDDKMGGRMVARTPTTGGRQKIHERKNTCQNIPLVFFNSQKLQEGNIFFIIVCLSFCFLYFQDSVDNGWFENTPIREIAHLVPPSLIT